MYDCDIVYMMGNPKSGSSLQHKDINNTIIKIMQNYTYKIVSSEYNNMNFIDKLPKAKVYIGFSRGSRYLKKLPNDSLKLSIGGINGSNIHLFRNYADNVIDGDISISSLNAHFIISNNDQNSIKLLVDKFLYRDKNVQTSTRFN
jgi:hypothetical protein